jgi:hypothetical protein
METKGVNFCSVGKMAHQQPKKQKQNNMRNE